MMYQRFLIVVRDPASWKNTIGDPVVKEIRIFGLASWFRNRGVQEGGGAYDAECFKPFRIDRILKLDLIPYDDAHRSA
jgi:hypothetical protein